MLISIALKQEVKKKSNLLIGFYTRVTDPVYIKEILKFSYTQQLCNLSLETFKRVPLLQMAWMPARHVQLPINSQILHTCAEKRVSSCR